MSIPAFAASTPARQPALGWRIACVLLGVLATGTSLLITVIAGIERGATLAERAAWIATGVVLLLAAHLLPALGRRATLIPKLAGLVLWVAAFLAVGYTHTTFFLNAQRGTGEQRAERIQSASPAQVAQKTRSRTAIAADIATATRTFELLKVQACDARCEGLHARKMATQARLAALRIEDQEAQRAERIEDAGAAAAATLAQDRALARTDPFVGVIAGFTGLSLPVAGVVIAACLGWMLDGVAAVAWLYATTAFTVPSDERILQESVRHAGRAEVRPVVANPSIEPANDVFCAAEPVGTPGVEDTLAASVVRTTCDQIHTQPVRDEASEVERLTSAIEAGCLLPTVGAIVGYIGCSQGRALALRQRLAESRPELFAIAARA
ncbi:hypothetical protein [Paraburkholderia sp. J8-2]|uniref:hypothetical protein n=1 Tax=Paraburkholderia sp. J8-2 TaxID=2805440 RepID=UPI002AB73429|nr:hypothetical protein [Paraburkholderia sp. J8-2]